MHFVRSLALALATAALVVPNALAYDPVPPPQALVGSYQAGPHTTSLSWEAADPEPWVYTIYRDSQALGTTEGRSFKDTTVPMGAGFLYFVTGTRDGVVSDPAVIGISTLSCEVVTVSTSWNYPYVYAHLHEECIGGLTYDKDVTWVHPQ